MSAEFHKNKTFKSAELSKCPFTGAGTPAKFSAGRGQTNRDFWPNLSLIHISEPTRP